LFNGFNFDKLSDSRDDFAALANHLTHVVRVNGEGDNMSVGVINSFING